MFANPLFLFKKLIANSQIQAETPENVLKQASIFNSLGFQRENMKVSSNGSEIAFMEKSATTLDVLLIFIIQ